MLRLCAVRCTVLILVLGISRSAGAADLTATWPILVAGDCALRNGSLTLRDDGTATWKAEVRTNKSRSRDIWHIWFFVFNDKGGLIQRLPTTLNSPPMRPDRGDYPWHEDFTYDKALFPLIQPVLTASGSSC